MAGFQEPELPPVEAWWEMMTGLHRSLIGLESVRYNVLMFTKAMYACMRLRGEDAQHLFAPGTDPDDKGTKVRLSDLRY